MIVVSRFAVPAEQVGEFAGLARSALVALGDRPGYVRGRVGRAADDPAQWVLVTEWEGIGAYRRALSAYEVKLTATPLMAWGRAEPSAFEVIHALDAGQTLETRQSDRADP